MSAFFTEDFLKFFKELAANNNKEWFDKNKPRYVKSVKEPFEAFVGHLIAKLKKSEGLGDMKPSECIFRINRDIRFSKDKTPYKTRMSAIIGRGGRKDMVTPSLYFELGPENLSIYTGVYMAEKDVIQAIREKIASNMKAFSKIIEAPDFKKVYGKVQGDKAKILPAEFKEKAKEQEVLFNKQFYLMHTHDPAIITKPALADYILEKYKVASAYNKFLESALKA